MLYLKTTSTSTFSFLVNEKTAKIICYSLIGLMLIAVCETILLEANWILGDDLQFLNYTAIDKFRSIMEDIRSDGRFFPLGLFDLNLTLIIPNGHTPFGHYYLVTIEFILSIVGLLYLFKNSDHEDYKLSDNYINAFYIILLILFSVSLVRIFMNIIFPEKILFLTLPLFMLFYQKGLKTQNIKYYIIAIFFAAYSTYCKEPVSGALLIIVLINGIGYKSLTKKDRIFNCILLINSIIFIILYYIIVYRNSVEFYNSVRAVETSSLVTKTFTTEKILIFIFILGAIRGFYVFFKKDRDHLYYDGLLFAGIGFCFAYMLLRLSQSYYFFPTIVLSLPAIVYWTKNLYRKKKMLALFIMLPIGLIACLNLAPVRQTRILILRDREEAMPYIESINKDYKNGKNLYWLEYDAGSPMGNEIRDFKKTYMNKFIGFVNKDTIPKDFFITIKQINNLNPDDIIFLPSIDLSQKMPVEVEKALTDSKFAIKTNRFVPYYEYKP
jgi:hypothetical protein